jgi:hypothetical protein
MSTAVISVLTRNTTLVRPRPVKNVDAVALSTMGRPPSNRIRE